MKRIKTSKWTLFLVLFFTLIFKNIICNYWCLGYCDNEPNPFIHYIRLILFPLLLSSFVFITKHKWWIIILLTIIDLWFFSNIIYFKINNLFIDYYTIKIAFNLSGFESSIIPYIKLIYLLLPFSSLLLILFIIWLKPTTNINITNWIVIIIITYGLSLWGKNDEFEFTSHECELSNNTSDFFSRGYWIPFFSTKYLINNYYYDFRKRIEEYGILSGYPYGVAIFIANENYIKEYQSSPLSEADMSLLQKCINTTSKPFSPKRNLIIILIESFESWPINLCDLNGSYIMPRLNQLINNEHISYIHKIKNQILSGRSGDGQMIINTGLLPISKGVACMLYAHNTYPNIASSYSNSETIVAWPNVWNQNIISRSYGYTTTIGESVNLYDEYTYHLAENCILENTTSDTIYSAYQIVTASSHLPFNLEINTSLNLPPDLPETLSGYLNVMHYVDSCTGNFIDSILYQFNNNIDIIITGDHTVTWTLMDSWKPYVSKYNYPIDNYTPYCPLIIYSPSIVQHAIIYDEVCYQMDIFPTIMHLIGNNDYYWNGFGVNLLDSVARKNRYISEAEAYQLSDKLIKKDYLKSIQHY